jgi:hypothetical protein
MITPSSSLHGTQLPKPMRQACPLPAQAEIPTAKEDFGSVILYDQDVGVLTSAGFGRAAGGVAGMVGIESGVVSGVFNLESSGVEVPDWRPRHGKRYHEVWVLAAAKRDRSPSFRQLD